MPPRTMSDSNIALTMKLLWGIARKTGWSGLSAASIVDAAVDLADQSGLDAVSMRHIATSLGAGTMSLYAHVPGKADLVSLMVDAVLGELYPDADAPIRAGGGWKGGLVFIAESNWALYDRHPWLLDVSGARPVLGPNACLKYEAELRPLEGIGLSDLEMDSVLTLVLTHVEGTARSLAAQRFAAEETGRDDRSWWEEAGPLLGELIDEKQFPVSSRVGSAAGEAYQAVGDPTRAFRFGLDRILDGVTFLLESKKASS